MDDSKIYTVAVNLENIDSGLITLHQVNFKCENRFEAIGRAVDKLMDDKVAIHSFKVSMTGHECGEISEYIDLLEQGRKIQAIKLYRERTGQGLRESKEFIDKLVIEFNINIKSIYR